jgi:hypothetical protein
LRLTFCIAAGGDFENRLPGGNAEKKCDYKIIEKFFKMSQAQTKADTDL